MWYNVRILRLHNERIDITMKTAFKSTNVLLPKGGIDLNKWSVIACDQYTYDTTYWEEVSHIVGESKSTLNLILPEVYLNSPDCESRIKSINANMVEYLSTDTFKEYANSYVYVERTQSDGKVRKGLVGMIDLEQYDYRKGSTSQVRATESTVVERIPPRLKVRENAPIEVTHIMVLIDDENKTVIEPLGDVKENLTKLYSTDLMQRGGHVEGFLVDSTDLLEQVDSALSELLLTNASKYNLPPEEVLLYAMGDGNHSLATAKEYYERLKASNPNVDYSNHPARYALVEVVNLHSEAIQFEAIHRIVTHVDIHQLISELNSTLHTTTTGDDSMQCFSYVVGGVETPLYVTAPLSNLTVGTVQSFLDSYLKANGGEIDYIHGRENVFELAQGEGSIGFILPDMLKSELFPTVIKDGSLPRKTFSMGHAEDKRFYCECRKIVE